MIHYTCDRCKRTIDPGTELRFVIEIDVRMVSVTMPNDEPFEDLDQLTELHNQLQRELSAETGLFSSDRNEIEDVVCGRDIDDGPEQYDLCEHCHEIFISNPLGRESTVGLGFSNN